MARRAEPFIERIAELLGEHDSRATFFVPGWIVEHLARLRPQQLRDDLRAAPRALLGQRYGRNVSAGRLLAEGRVRRGDGRTIVAHRARRCA